MKSWRWAALAVLATLAWLPGSAHARSLAVFSYPIADTWPTAVRFLRVDRNCPIREKDESAGYILFDYADGAKTFKGSLELIRTTDGEGRDATRAAISLPDLPRHYEQVLLDKLAFKLREDRGSPAPPPPPKKEGETKPPPDAGAAK